MSYQSGAEMGLCAADTSGKLPCGQSLAPVTSAHGSKRVKFSVNAANSTVCPVFSSMWLLESVRATSVTALSTHCTHLNRFASVRYHLSSSGLFGASDRRDPNYPAPTPRK